MCCIRVVCAGTIAPAARMSTGLLHNSSDDEKQQRTPSPARTQCFADDSSALRTRIRRVRACSDAHIALAHCYHACPPTHAHSSSQPPQIEVQSHTEHLIYGIVMSVRNMKNEGINCSVSGEYFAGWAPALALPA